MIALSKADGKVVWETALESATLSSPAAVYNEDGDAWLIQAESNGKIHLMDATDGSILDSADPHRRRGRGKHAGH